MSAEEIRKFKAHGCLMVFTWVFLASTGILLARYFRYLLSKLKFCGGAFWFFLHRPIMISVPLISIAAFLIVLSALDWKWIKRDEHLNFAHSIIGIITIGFAVIQPIIALFRCDPNHKYRFIFNYVHRFIGILTLVLAIVAMYLGFVMEELNFYNSGWALLLGWCMWLAIVVAILEAMDYRVNNYGTRDIAEKNKAESVKTYSLIAHVLVSLGFTIALVILIGTRSGEEEEEAAAT